MRKRTGKVERERQTERKSDEGSDSEEDSNSGQGEQPLTVIVRRQ